MKRFRAIAVLLFALTIVTVAQDPWKVMNWKTETTLRTYLLQQMHHQYDMRRSSLATAVSDYRITALELSETIGTFAEVTDRPTGKDWFSYLVPGIMKYFDIPDVARIRPVLKIKYVNR